MKTTIVILTGIVIILLLLLYLGNKDNKVELKQQRELYEDSLQRYAYTQDLIEAEKRAAIEEKNKELARQVQTKEAYERDNLFLRAELKKSRTPKVEKLIAEEPELQLYISMYDSLLDLSYLRIDSLELEKRIAIQLYDNIIAKSDSLLNSEREENNYLKTEVDKLYVTVEKLEKKVRQRTWLTGFFALLNLVPRD